MTSLVVLVRRPDSSNHPLDGSSPCSPSTTEPVYDSSDAWEREETAHVWDTAKKRDDDWKELAKHFHHADELEDQANHRPAKQHERDARKEAHDATHLLLPAERVEEVQRALKSDDKRDSHEQQDVSDGQQPRIKEEHNTQE